VTGTRSAARARATQFASGGSTGPPPVAVMARKAEGQGPALPGGIALSGLYSLAMIPLTPALIATRRLLLELEYTI
jgi:hypothetical protein